MSQIEQIITEIEDYMDSCKFQPLSQTKLIVNKDEMEELLTELRLKMPDEIVTGVYRFVPGFRLTSIMPPATASTAIMYCHFRGSPSISAAKKTPKTGMSAL